MCGCASLISRMCIFVKDHLNIASVLYQIEHKTGHCFAQRASWTWENARVNTDKELNTRVMMDAEEFGCKYSTCTQSSFRAFTKHQHRQMHSSSAL